MTCGTISQEVRVVPDLIPNVIVGRDCPLFVKLWDNVSQELLGQWLDAKTDSVAYGPDGQKAKEAFGGGVLSCRLWLGKCRGNLYIAGYLQGG